MPLHIIKEAEEFQPHMAVTSILLNDGAANKRNIPIVQKSKLKSDKEINLLKLLNASPEVLEKASTRNTEKMLSAVIREEFADDDCCYCWVWLRDFDPITEVAVFEMNEGIYSIKYNTTPEGLIELVGEKEEVIHHDVYTTSSSNSLVLKGEKTPVEEQKDSEVSGVNNEDVSEEIISKEASDDNETKQKQEEVMSDKDNAPVEFTKAQKDAIAELLKAEREAVQKETADAQLVKSTKEALAGLEFIQEGDVEVLAKSVVTSPELLDIVVKSLSSAQEIIKAKDAEMNTVREEFATKEQVTDEAAPVDIEKGNLQAQLKANIAKLKANKQ